MFSLAFLLRLLGSCTLTKVLVVDMCLLGSLAKATELWLEDDTGLLKVPEVGVAPWLLGDLGLLCPLELDITLWCVPGPVSWLGSGAVRGSSRYLEAWMD